MNEQLLEVATRFNKLHTDDDDDADLKSALDRIEHAMGVGLPTEEEEQPEVRRRLIDNLGSALGLDRERVDEFYVKCVEEIRWWRAALSKMVEEVDLAPFKVLEVAPDAPGEDIRHAYRKLARRHHPDRNPGDDDAEERFKAIEAAYEKVKAIRADYDQKRKEGVDPRFAKKYPVMAVEKRGARQKKKERKEKKKVENKDQQPIEGIIEKEFWKLVYNIVAIMENGSSSLITSGTMDMALVAKLDGDGRPLSKYLVG
jgi:DnaJ-domain-containing protein 1